MICQWQKWIQGWINWSTKFNDSINIDEDLNLKDDNFPTGNAEMKENLDVVPEPVLQHSALH